MMLPMTTNNATGRFLRKIFPRTRMRERAETEAERGGVRFVQVRKEMAGPFPKTAVRAFEAKELRQLRAGQEERDAALETDHHAFGDEIDDRSSFGPPGNECDHSDEKAVPAASALKRVASPPVISPNEAPTSSEMAEVTVIAVWRELQNSQKTSPEKRQA